MHRPYRSYSRSTATLAACVLVSFGLSSSSVLAAGYQQQNLVTDDAGFLASQGYTPAATVDPALKNPWGLTLASGFPAWVSNAGSGTATLYFGNGAKVPHAFFDPASDISIPPPAGSPPGTMSAPTGQVFNGTGAFIAPGQTAASLFIFATEGGTLAQFNNTPTPPPGLFSSATQTAVDNSANHAVYKGLASATVNNHEQLYATDFHNGKIDVFNQNFGSVLNGPGAFIDPNLPVGYAPFGIQNVNGDLFVTYAKQLGPNNVDDKAGIGHGFIDVFHADGTLARRFASRGVLNSPWGIALAPASFGELGGALLVGNFGDGLINAFDPVTGAFIDHVVDANGEAIVIEDLWALAFSDGSAGQFGPGFSKNTLYFTAGIGDEAHGLFGAISAVPVPAAVWLLGSALGSLGFARRRNS